jgi:DNA-binding CsgD family transcriptional regulator
MGEQGPGLVELAAGAQALEALAPADRQRARAVAVNAAERDAPLGPVLSQTAYAGRYAGALELAEEWFLPTVTAPDADPTSPTWAAGWTGLAFTYIGLGRPAEARVALDRSRTGHEREGQYGRASTVVFEILEWLVLPYAVDDLRGRERALANLVAAVERAGGIWGEQRDWVSIRLRLLEGRWDDAGFAQVETLLPQRRDAIQLSWQRRHLAWRYRERGERREAWAQIDTLLPRGVATEPGDVRFLPAVATQCVAVALALDADDLPTAHAWLEAHDRWMAWSGAVLGRAEGAALWACYYRQSGDRERADDYAQQTLAHATEPRQPLALLAAHRLLGELDTAAGRFEAATAHLDAALALAAACVAPYERGLTLLACADLHAATGNRANAEIALTEVRTICMPLGAKPALARADALVARLDATPTAPTSYPAGLTAREVEVLRLVAEGLTDAQVAEQLFLSTRTVNQHLRTIYNKLGVSSRAAATRFVTEHGLLP